MGLRDCEEDRIVGCLQDAIVVLANPSKEAPHQSESARQEYSKFFPCSGRIHTPSYSSSTIGPTNVSLRVSDYQCTCRPDCTRPGAQLSGAFMQTLDDRQRSENAAPRQTPIITPSRYPTAFHKVRKTSWRCRGPRQFQRCHDNGAGNPSAHGGQHGAGWLHCVASLKCKRG